MKILTQLLSLVYGESRHTCTTTYLGFIMQNQEVQILEIACNSGRRVLPEKAGFELRSEQYGS